MEVTIFIITALLFIAVVVIPTLATRLWRARTELRETREELCQTNSTLTEVRKKRGELTNALRTIEARRVIIEDTAPVPRTGEKPEMYQRHSIR